MSDESRLASNRRQFLTGRALQTEVERLGGELADALTAGRVVPAAGPTVRLGTRAMACDFAVILNPGPAEEAWAASDALDLVHQLEAQMTVYRDDSELAAINRRAADEEVEVEPQLFGLLREAIRLAERTEGAFDPTSGPLIALWRRCRHEGCIPTQAEIDRCREQVGYWHVHFDEGRHTIRYDRQGVELNLGGIGKGYALDRAGAMLDQIGLTQWLLHGGHSSILARGDHNRTGGWPVGIRDPNFPQDQLATLLLQNSALSTSGSGTQHFRHAGRRYGHILDPRTGWPVEGMLSVTVLASTAAEADALSTAFFVMGVENAATYCHNFPETRALLIPPPRRGRTLEPRVLGIPAETLFLASADGQSE